MNEQDPKPVAIEGDGWTLNLARESLLNCAPIPDFTAQLRCPLLIVEKLGAARWPKLSDKERAAIMESTDTASRRIVAIATGLARNRGDTLARSLAFTETRRLNSPGFLGRVITEALAGNERFFVKVGEALKQKARSLADSYSAPAMRLHCFLVNHWRPDVTEGRQFVPLCFFSASALTSICKQTLAMPDLSRSAVVSARKRLGLRPSKRADLRIRHIEGLNKTAPFVY